MNCPTCQTANPIGRELCLKCSTLLKAPVQEPSANDTGRRCLGCGADMPLKAMFCGKCGTPLKPATAPTPEPVPDTQPSPELAAPAPPMVEPVAPPPMAGNTVKPEVRDERFDPRADIRAERREAKAELIAPGNSLRPMVLIPAGEFLMGSPADIGNPDEHPQHKVKLSAYYIDRHAVTNLEYERFDPGHQRSRPDVADGDNDPAVMVNYADCLKYCRWRAEQEKVPLDSYTLPTEAQWERAARGGYPDRLYAWGDSIHPDACNTLETGRRRAVSIDLGIPNGFMLFHMGSNVREWCLDCYSATYFAQKLPLWIDPQGPAPSPWDKFRVVRGASFIELGATLGRCAARGFAAPKNAQTDIGFRCVRLVTLR